MTVTGVNTGFPDKFSKTVLNCVREDTGKILDGFYVERKLEVVSGVRPIFIFVPARASEKGNPVSEKHSSSHENPAVSTAAGQSTFASSAAGACVFRLFRRGAALKPAVLEMIRRISSPWWLCTIGAESEGGSNLN